MPEASAGREARYTDLGSLRPEQRRAKRTQPRGFKKPSSSAHTSGHNGVRQDHHNGSNGSGSSSLRPGHDHVASPQAGSSHRRSEQHAEEFRQIPSQGGAVHANTSNTTEQSIPRRPPLDAGSLASTSRSQGSSVATSRYGDFQTMSFLEFSSRGRASISTQDSRQWPTPLRSQDLRRASIGASRNAPNNNIRSQNSVCIDLTLDSSSSSSESELPDYDSSSTNEHRHLASSQGLSKSQPSNTVPPQNPRQPQSRSDTQSKDKQGGAAAAEQASNVGVPILPSGTPRQVQRERSGPRTRSPQEQNTFNPVGRPPSDRRQDATNARVRSYSAAQHQSKSVHRSLSNQDRNLQPSPLSVATHQATRQPSHQDNAPVCASQPGPSTTPKPASTWIVREKPKFISPPPRDSSSPESDPEVPQVTPTDERSSKASAVAEPTSRQLFLRADPDVPQVKSTDERSSNGRAVLEPTPRQPLSRAEQLRQKRLESFDSDAFDAAIYQQEGTNPPAGLQISIAALRQIIPLPAFAQRQALSPNRYIHGMHPPLPAADQAARDAEIAARGGRKLWFRRVAARQAMRIQKDRSVPAWQRPRVAYRVRDISFLAEHELPNEVRENEGWMDFWRWYRQGKLEARRSPRRQRKAGLSSGCNLRRPT
ncbi:hypothetical protein CC79DRAFT_1372919 [Sarocladium strictum]